MSLCYLWQREQEPLLKEMLDSGVQAIMVKVATAGLCGRQLGKSMNELQPLLLNLVRSNRLLNDTNLLAQQVKTHQINCCGEGGEYETLTLDCPLFKKRIVM